MVKARAIAVLLIVSSLALICAGAVATAMACGWDFVLHLWVDGRCAMGGTPYLVWAGAIASFGVFMKIFWATVGAFALWRKLRRHDETAH